MDNHQRIAVVTGGNRGIGFEICRQLAKEGITVILTSRDEAKGIEACETLQKENLNVQHAKLDVSDPLSIQDFATHIQRQYGRCDILINNAGIFPDSTDASNDDWPSVFTSSVETIKKAMETNVYGPLLLCQSLISLMKQKNYGRIVNLSSGMGRLQDMNGGCPGYRISKTSINALTCIMAAELEGTNILVNSMCPGWVKTDMGGSNATRSVDEGADTAVWLATLADDGPTGGFFRDRKPMPW